MACPALRGGGSKNKLLSVIIVNGSGKGFPGPFIFRELRGSATKRVTRFCDEASYECFFRLR